MPNYLPKPGDVVATPQTDFPMTVETFDANRMVCALVGFDPQANDFVRLPEVCAFDLTPATAAE